MFLIQLIISNSKCYTFSNFLIRIHRKYIIYDSRKSLNFQHGIYILCSFFLFYFRARISPFARGDGFQSIFIFFKTVWNKVDPIFPIKLYAESICIILRNVKLLIDAFF